MQEEFENGMNLFPWQITCYYSVKKYLDKFCTYRIQKHPLNNKICAIMFTQQYNAMQYNATRCDAMQYNTTEYNTIKWNEMI